MEGKPSDLAVVEALVSRLASEIGADGSMLTYRGSADDAPCVIFADAPFDGIGTQSPQVVNAAATAPTSPASNGRGDKLWGDISVEDESYSVLNLPFPRPREGLFEVKAIFRGSDARLPRSGERALRTMHEFLAGSLELWESGQRSSAQATGLACALDRSDIGIVLLDDASRLLFANRCADRLLTAGLGIRHSGNSIAASDLSDALRLKVAIDHVSRLEPDDFQDFKAPVVTLRRKGSQRALIVSVMPPERRSAASAILFLFDPDLDVAPLVATACRFYGLSPVEVRLTCLLVGGTSLLEASRVMRVKEQTARSYLKQIFQKTDIGRQADLVRLMLSSIVRTACPVDPRLA